MAQSLDMARFSECLNGSSFLFINLFGHILQEHTIYSLLKFRANFDLAC